VRRLLRSVDEYVGLRGGKSLVMRSFWRLLNISGLWMGIGRIGSHRDLWISRHPMSSVWLNWRRKVPDRMIVVRRIKAWTGKAAGDP
jgi:hypothetical protein